MQLLRSAGEEPALQACPMQLRCSANDEHPRPVLWASTPNAVPRDDADDPAGRKIVSQPTDKDCARAFVLPTHPLHEATHVLNHEELQRSGRPSGQGADPRPGTEEHVAARIL
eukprot:383443-Lingulodinium_polyedra.AAC.1